MLTTTTIMHISANVTLGQPDCGVWKCVQVQELNCVYDCVWFIQLQAPSAEKESKDGETLTPAKHPAWSWTPPVQMVSQSTSTCQRNDQFRVLAHAIRPPAHGCARVYCTTRISTTLLERKRKVMSVPTESDSLTGNTAGTNARVCVRWVRHARCAGTKLFIVLPLSPPLGCRCVVRSIGCWRR